MQVMREKMSGMEATMTCLELRFGTHFIYRGVDESRVMIVPPPRRSLLVIQLPPPINGLQGLKNGPIP